MKLMGEFIKRLRQSKDISQRELGSFFDPPVTTQFISNIERGVTALPISHVATLAKSLGVDDTEVILILEKEYSLNLRTRLGKITEVDERKGT